MLPTKISRIEVRETLNLKPVAQLQFAPFWIWNNIYIDLWQQTLICDNKPRRPLIAHNNPIKSYPIPRFLAAMLPTPISVTNNDQET